MKLSRMFRKRTFLFWLLALTTAGCVSHRPQGDPGSAAEARAVEFLKREVPAWSREHRCFSCHNNGDAARALYVAARRGYIVQRSVLADTTAWLAQPNRWRENKGEPGFNDQRLANLQFGAALLTAIATGFVNDRRPLVEAVRKIAADQDADGAWRIEPGNAVGSPATYGTALATSMALSTLRQAKAPNTEEAIRRAENWLWHTPLDNLPAAASLLLAIATGDVQLRAEPLNLIRRAQTRDGGWGPYADSPPEPFDTAIVLLALSGSPNQQELGEMIQKGRHFLIAQQAPDGSWPATTRPPGGDSYAQKVSTTAWATLALLATTE